MTEQQKEILAIAYELATMSNALEFSLKRLHNNGLGIQAQDVERCTELHNKAVRLQEIVEAFD